MTVLMQLDPRCGIAVDGVRVWYKNYKGEERVRHVLPKRLWWGSTQWHPEPQWLVDAFDMEECVDRTFAMRDMREAE